LEIEVLCSVTCFGLKGWISFEGGEVEVDVILIRSVVLCFPTSKTLSSRSELLRSFFLIDCPDVFLNVKSEDTLEESSACTFGVELEGGKGGTLKVLGDSEGDILILMELKGFFFCFGALKVLRILFHIFFFLAGDFTATSIFTPSLNT